MLLCTRSSLGKCSGGDARLTIDLLEHGAHVFEIAVIQEPNLWIPVILLIWDCTVSQVSITILPMTRTEPITDHISPGCRGS